MEIRETINLYDIDLACVARYHSGFSGNFSEPPSSESIELEEVFVGGKDIIMLLSYTIIEEIEKELLELHKSREESACEDRGDY